MPTSQEDLQSKSEDLQKLRDQVANAEATRVEREREVANDVTMRQLEAEEAALKARLAVAKDAGKVGSVRQGASAPLDAVKADLERAVAQQKAAETTSRAARATESTTATEAGGDASAASGDAASAGEGGN